MRITLIALSFALAGPVLVRQHALAMARELTARTRTNITRDWFDCTFVVTDEKGQTVLELPFGETVPVMIS